MLLESTPERQHIHNDAVHKSSRLILSMAVVLIACAVSLGVVLYFNMHGQSQEPTITAADGTTSIGFAVPVAAEYVLTTADAQLGSQLVIGSEKIPVTVVRNEKPQGIPLTLLHLQSPMKVIPNLRELQNGEGASARAAAGSWDGTLNEGARSAPIEPQPAITIGDIAPVTAKSDGALLGISAPGAKGDIVVSTRDLVAAFPELKR